MSIKRKLNELIVEYKVFNETDMDYNSYICLNKYAFSSISVLYRPSLEYRHAYDHKIQKINKQIKNIDILNRERLKYNMTQILIYMKLIVFSDNNISSKVFGFMSQDVEYYKKTCENVVQKIVLYKDKIKSVDDILRKNMLDTYHKYLINVVL